MIFPLLILSFRNFLFSKNFLLSHVDHFFLTFNSEQCNKLKGKNSSKGKNWSPWIHKKSNARFRVKFEKIWVLPKKKKQPEICSVDIRKHYKYVCLPLSYCSGKLFSVKKNQNPLEMYSLSLFTNQEFYSINTN